MSGLASGRRKGLAAPSDADSSVKVNEDINKQLLDTIKVLQDDAKENRKSAEMVCVALCF